MIKDAGNLVENFGVLNPDYRVHRLSNATRKLASRALSGEFGRELIRADFALDENLMAEMSDLARYAYVVDLIARFAPLRIIEGEKMIGSATYLEATEHVLPGLGIPSLSHNTIGFEKILQIGYRGLRIKIQERFSGGDLDEEGRDNLKAMSICLDAAGNWHRRYLDLLKTKIGQSTGKARENYTRLFTAMENVPENPPATFHEALLSLWMMWSFQRLCGNWSGIGRIDKMLGPFLKADLKANRITLDEARELLAHFWIKGCEWIGSRDNYFGGDAQFYQNIILSGIDALGSDVTNEVTYLVLDVVEELHISDFPIAVRINEHTSEKLYRRIAEVQRIGGGIVSIYNEELILRSLVKFGYPLEEAREFTNDGCWEVLIPGKSFFSYCPFDVLLIFQETLGMKADALVDFPDFETLYNAFMANLKEVIDSLHTQADDFCCSERMSPLLSLFIDDCIEKARDCCKSGAKYNVQAFHAGGLPDVINSLFVLKKFIYEEKAMSLNEFVEILRANWKGNDELRKKMQHRYELYGNNSSEVDSLAVRVYDDYVKCVSNVKERNGVLRPAGISTFGREIAFRTHRLATPFGTFKGDVLATNFAPTPGTDHNGPTAVINSFCKMDFEKLPNGVPLELKILPSDLEEEKGLQILIALMQTFIKQGGWYLHIDSVDANTLRDAQKHPEKYTNLSVRISGWSARFVTLGEDWQEMIINRTEQKVS